MKNTGIEDSTCLRGNYSDCQREVQNYISFCGLELY